MACPPVIGAPPLQLRNRGRSPCSGRRGRLDLQQLAHPVDQLSISNGLCRKSSAAGQLQLLDLVLLDHAGDAEDAHVFQRGVGADALADFLAVDVRQHDVEDDQVGPIFLDHHAGVEAVVGDADLEAAVLFEDLGHQLDQFGIVVDEQDLALAALEGVGRDAVVLHELVEHLAGDAAEAASRARGSP